MTNIAIFASGRGSNFQSVHAKILGGEIPGRIAVLICDNPNAGAIDYAHQHKIPVAVVPPRDYPTPEGFGRALIEILQQHGISLIVLAGYLKKIPDNLVEHYSNRILNIHPALLPAFGGKGMYGINVHRAVFQSGAQVSGVTVHLVNCEYDAGPIVLQKAVDIRDCSTPEQIAEKVLAVEHQLLPEAVKLLLEHEIEIDGQRVWIKGVKNDYR